MKNGGIGSLSFKCIEEKGILFIHAPVLMFNFAFLVKNSILFINPKYSKKNQQKWFGVKNFEVFSSS